MKHASTWKWFMGGFVVAVVLANPYRVVSLLILLGTLVGWVAGRMSIMSEGARAKRRT